MSANDAMREQRLQELLIEQAVFGLDATAHAELASLQRTAAPAAAGSSNPWDEIAALVQLGLAAMDIQQRGVQRMPASLRAKIAAGARRAD